MKGVIYQVVNAKTGKTYIGQTTKKLSKRIREHKRAYRKFKLQSAIKKYGVENFVFEVLEEIVESNKEKLKSILDKYEKYYIKVFDTYSSGYNMTIGGEGGSFWFGKKRPSLSKETKEKLSNALRGRKVSIKTREKLSVINRGSGNPNFGKTTSTETRGKLSEVMKIKAPFKDKHLSQEHRKKLSESHKGQKSHMKGKHHSEETKRKISNTKLNRRR